MAATIATAEEYWLIFSFRLFKCLITLWVPIYWILGMLEQIKTLLIYQSIGIFVHEITPKN
ncbi:hypothetical protein LMF89_24085 [Pelosinus sp. Bkl1]|uniref:Uncharacterized protein n=1 Tax=Pelosinus baikalensis TaxID=2892015 RepID=A0ABS8HZ39_9FIRM|nr:hypothetical protein [Pelosinus baikalensis]